MCIRTRFLLLFLTFSQAAHLQVLPGAYDTDNYLKILSGRSVALVVNHTSTVGNVNLVDTLISSNIKICKLFSPEHGIRGNKPAGHLVNNMLDPETGLKVISLYGKKYKPSLSDLEGIDVVVFDIQDVGVRVYTYISTLHYIMEACAESNISLLLLDRPNPNGFYVDGPVLDTTYRSFVGLHPVPLVYGMTIGEYAQMINGEGWLKNRVRCDLNVVKCKGYYHRFKYKLKIAPSPNLRDMQSVYLYPSLVLFEGTVVNVGRGTPYPFKIYGHPCLKIGNHQYTPRPDSLLKDPPHANLLCNGVILKNDTASFTLKYLLDAYKNLPCEKDFFNPFFTNLAGNKDLLEQIKQNWTEEKIRSSWKPGLDSFNMIRKKYLIYEDF